MNQAAESRWSSRHRNDEHPFLEIAYDMDRQDGQGAGSQKQIFQSRNHGCCNAYEGYVPNAKLRLQEKSQNNHDATDDPRQRQNDIAI